MRRLESMRPRTSTIVLAGLFLAVLALYILVRPAPAPAGAAQPAPGPASPLGHPIGHTVSSGHAQPVTIPVSATSGPSVDLPLASA